MFLLFAAANAKFLLVIVTLITWIATLPDVSTAKELELLVRQAGTWSRVQRRYGLELGRELGGDDLDGARWNIGCGARALPA